MENISIAEALEITVVSMGIVFGLLIFLQFVIRLQGAVLKMIDKSGAKKKEEVVKKEIKKPEIIEEVSKTDDLELVAAIMGALSTYLDVPTSGLKIKSIKRVSSNNWRNAGIKTGLR